MVFTIQSPDFARPIPLFKNKFVMTVKGPPEHVRSLHVVLKDANGMRVTGAYPVRDDGGNATRLWSLILDLGSHTVDTTRDYTLEGYRQSGNGRPSRIDFGSLIRFRFGRLFPMSDVRKEIVQIIYPDPNTTHSRYGFTPYGIVDESNEYTTSSLGKVFTSTVNDTADAGDTDIDGFWWLTFDEVAAGLQDLTVESNLSNYATVRNLTFS